MKTMKTFVHSKQICLKLVLLISFSACSILAQSQAQSSPELKFENSSLYSGTAGEDGAVYLFPDVNSTMDALVKINGRSSSSVNITNIDISNQGFSKAFQPQIRYGNGNVSGAITWWAEFEIQFVNMNTTIPATISEAFVTGLDIDGNNSNLREWDAFYGSSSYTVESNSSLSVSLVTGILNQLTLAGQRFLGTLSDHPGIDTSATELMTTHRYLNTNSITVRFGATTTGSTGNANRMYSVWFKNFSYTAPMNTLPVKLASFTATLNNNKADLKWTTASEINVSHFVIEKSLDGTNFSEAGIMFAYGNATDLTSYSFSDNLANTTSTIVYYRLRSVDMDGKAEYSATRIIRTSKQKDNAISILTYPNPVSNELRITIPAAWQNKPVVYELFTVNGQSVKRSQSGNSGQTETLNLSTLAPGLYIVKVSCEGAIAQQKIVKQ